MNEKNVSVFETEPEERIIEELIALSAEWEAEKSCFGYRKNEKADITGNRIFVAVKDGAVIGYLFGHGEKAKKSSSIMTEKTPYFEVEELYVRPQWRNKGIGRQLFSAAENAAKNGGDEFLMLSTATKNWKAVLHFYLEELNMEFWNARLFKKIQEDTEGLQQERQ